MSDAVRVLPGSFAQSALKLMAIDTSASGGGTFHRVTRTPGFVATTPLPASPTALEAWQIQGFTVTVRMVAVIGTLSPGFQYFARLGDLWAGIIVDKPLPPQPPGLFPIWPPCEMPTDLTPFTKIFSGRDDHLNVANSNTDGDPGNYTIVTQNFQLPFPQTIRPGSQLNFALIMTPSTIDDILSLWFKDCNFSIIYSTIDSRKGG